MKRRKWTAQQKLQIVLQGLQAKASVTELCNRHQISQTQYYQWKDRLLKDGSKIFDHGGPNREVERLKRYNLKLKNIIEELTVELKKAIRSGYEAA